MSSNGAELKGKRIVLCVTGSSAAFKSPEIARGLMRRGAEVYTVMTEASKKLIHPDLMKWATGNKVVTELTGEIEHVSLAGKQFGGVDLILVAPVTANTISKVACGVADTTVTALVAAALGMGTPVIMAPAMHIALYNNKVLKSNMRKLEQMGVDFIGPKIMEGKAKIADTNVIVKGVVEKLSGKEDLKGLNILVTAGPTREPLDPVRFLTNPSSGKMGVSIACEALARGGEVTLVYGPGTEEPPSTVNLIKVFTTEEMFKAVVSELKSKKYHILVLAAAPLDFGFEERFNRKIPSERGTFKAKLRVLPKIADVVRELDKEVFFIGFKAEYKVSEEELIERGYERLKETGMDLIVANDVGKEGIGFSSDYNEVYIIDKRKRVVHLPLKPKKEIAREIINVALKDMKERLKGSK